MFICLSMAEPQVIFHFELSKFFKFGKEILTVSNNGVVRLQSNIRLYFKKKKKTPDIFNFYYSFCTSVFKILNYINVNTLRASMKEPCLV